MADIMNQTNEQNESARNLAELMQRHVFVDPDMFDGKLEYVPLFSETRQATRDFLSLHDRFNEASAVFSRFVERYSTAVGPLSIEECAELARSLKQTSIGDVEGLFSELDSRLDRLVTPYWRFFRGDKKEIKQVMNYENRLAELVRENVTRYWQTSPPRTVRIATGFGEELWRRHISFDDFAKYPLSELLFQETLAAFLGPNFVEKEHVRIKEKNSGSVVWTAFEKNARKSIPRRFAGRNYEVLVTPCLQEIRRLVPQSIQPQASEYKNAFCSEYKHLVYEFRDLTDSDATGIIEKHGWHRAVFDAMARGKDILDFPFLEKGRGKYLEGFVRRKV
jgi:hypothetical protein